MDYVYCFSNTSLTLRLAQYLDQAAMLPLQSMTVIHQVEGWLVRLQLHPSVSAQQRGDLQSLLQELGEPCQVDSQIQAALMSLEAGQPIVSVMRRHQVAIVSHGRPDCREIDEFRQQFVRGLGYCPETLV
jgi:hypothetical protein